MNTEKIQNETARVKRLNEDLKMEMELFNELAQKVRELLNREVKKPFEIDPVLFLDLEFEEPIRLNEFLSREIFNSTTVEITGVRIKDSFIEFMLHDNNGNMGREKVYLGEKVDTIRFWEYVLISLISWHVSDSILDKKERLGGFLMDLKEVLDTVEN
jgi:hypothetical protein